MDENAVNRSGLAQMILPSRAARLAAVAAIIIAAGLLMIHSDPPAPEPPPIRKVAKSPAEMLSVMSLNMAYRRGGLEAVDDVSHEAFNVLGSSPAQVSVRELLAGSNGV